MVKAVIFDMDGLMFDTERLTADSWVYTGKKLGFPITEELALSVIGIRDVDVRSMFSDKFGPSFDFETARLMRVAHMEDGIERNGVPVKKGLYSLLDGLRELGIKTAVASSTEKKRVMYCLDKAGVTDRFDAIVCGDMVKRGKPEPDAFLLAAELLGTAPGDCMVLEDSIYGVTAAYRAGIPVIMVPDLVAPTPETDAMAMKTVSSLEDVMPIIKR